MFSLRLKTFLVAAATTISSYHVYDVTTSPSQFAKASEELGLSTPKQEALLKIFTMAGYLKKQKIWEDVNKSKIFGENTQSVFKELYQLAHTSGADKANPNVVNTQLLNKELFGKSKKYFWQKPDIDTQQVQDWILYVSQNAFDRKVGQERNELTSKDWMKQYKAEYLSATQILGLIDRINPDRTEYDGGWIAGASRLGALARVMDFQWNLKHGATIKGDSKILAGSRPIWAEIDGIHPDVLSRLEAGRTNGTKIDDINLVEPDQASTAKTNNGVEYIISLAARLGIKLVPELPVIKYSTKEDCPKGFFPGRTYPNYADTNGPKLDESKMSLDIMNLVLGNNKIGIVDTQSQHHQRPTTETTTKDATERFLQDIKDGKYGDQKEFHILFETNNPYIERQTLSAQQAVNAVIAKSDLKDISIILHGVGFACRESVERVHSELGALMHVHWTISNPYRVDKDLCFQTRDNDAPVPVLEIEHLGDSGSTDSGE